MNNSTLQLKFKQRLNKIASNDYDNIECWQIVETFNKAQISWCRRQLHGTNQYREGDEASKRRIDDLQILLTTVELTGVDTPYDEKYGYFQSDNFNLIYNPSLGGDYLEYKRLEVKAVQALEYVPEIPPEYETIEYGSYMYWARCPSDNMNNPCSTNPWKHYCNYWVQTNDPEAWNESTLQLDPNDPLFGAFISTEEDLPTYMIEECLEEEGNQIFNNGYGPFAAEDSEDVLIPGTGVPAVEAALAPGASKEKCCKEPRTMTVYLSEVANTDIILRDPLKDPDFEWGETICTFQDNEVRIWRKDFFILRADLIYYRKPRFIQIEGCVDPYTSQQATEDIECEFKDDIVELMIDEAISILAGDISDPNQFQRGDSLSEKNN